MKKFLKKSIAVILCFLLVMPTMLTSVLGATLIDESLLREDRFVTSETSYRVTNGAVEKNILLNNAAGDYQTSNYVFEVDLNNPDLSIVAGYPNASAEKWEMGDVPSQAKAMEKKLGLNIIGAFNSDYYNTRTGEPMGLLVMNGKQYHAANKHPYFAILKDGTAVIRDADVPTDDVAEASGGLYIIVRNGEVQEYKGELKPRSAVGIKADGTVVFMVSDGRQAPEACGMDFVDLAYAMKALGCVTALELDGGGSATFMSEREAVSSLSVRNSPCYNFPRPVATSLMVCSSAEPSEYFDHITFTEKSYKVHPNNSVQVKAIPCDINGFEVKTNGKLVVEDSSYGTIIGNTFFAKKKEGTVRVNYVVDNYVVDSVEVYIGEDVDDFVTAGIKNFLQELINLVQFIEFVYKKLRGWF